MAIKRPVIVLGTGRRFSRGVPEHGREPEPFEEEAIRAGAVPVTVEAFVEFDAGAGYQRWALDWGLVVIGRGENATSALIRAGEMELSGNDLPAAELGIGGMRVNRWQAAAAPRRLELDPELARELSIE